MLSYLSFSGFFLSLILLGNKARKYKPINYLSFFFLFLSIYGINQYILLFSKSVFLVALSYTNFTPFYYLIGPMLYWYIRSILADDYRLRKRDLWYLLPAIVYLTAALPYIFTPISYKLEIASKIVGDIGFIRSYNETFLSDMFSNTAVFLSRPVLVFCYTLWSIGLFARFLLRKSYRMVFARQFFMTKWLFLLLGFQFMLVICYLLSVSKIFPDNSDAFLTLNSLLKFSAIGLTGLLVSPILFRGILYGLPRFPDLISKMKTYRAG